MKFTVDRATWARGDANFSRLLTYAGNRCCLGFMAKQCGVPDSVILDVRSPSGLDASDQQLLPKWLLDVDAERAQAGNSPNCYLAMEANDHNQLSDQEREKKLKEIFAQNGDEIEFIG